MGCGPSTNRRLFQPTDRRRTEQEPTGFPTVRLPPQQPQPQTQQSQQQPQQQPQRKHLLPLAQLAASRTNVVAPGCIGRGHLLAPDQRCDKYCSCTLGCGNDGCRICSPLRANARSSKPRTSKSHGSGSGDGSGIGSGSALVSKAYVPGPSKPGTSKSLGRPSRSGSGSARVDEPDAAGPSRSPGYGWGQSATRLYTPGGGQSQRRRLLT